MYMIHIGPCTCTRRTSTCTHRTSTCTRTVGPVHGCLNAGYLNCTKYISEFQGAHGTYQSGSTDTCIINSKCFYQLTYCNDTEDVTYLIGLIDISSSFN